MTTDGKREAYVEVREYVHTVLTFFDKDGNFVGEESQRDDTWNDTLEVRPMTDDERKDWL